MFQAVCTGTMRQKVLCVLIGVGSVSVYAQTEMDIREMLFRYQKKMDESAELWLQKKYAKAKDGFHQAEDILLDHMPPPSQAYVWSGWCALKTYTLLLVRLVEVDQYCGDAPSKLCEELTGQAIHWSDVLIDQTRAWNEVEPSQPDELPSRLQWMKRFQSAILRVQKLKNMNEGGVL